MKTVNKNHKTILGLWKLFRAVPVLTFSGSLILINIAFAKRQGTVFWYHVLPLIVGVFLINGFLGHSLNDINDWESGTDRASQGILSGGSKVLKEGLFHKDALSKVAFLSLLVILLIGLYLYLFRGLLVIMALAIGVFTAWAYTCPPLRLAYKPFLGELMGLWMSGVVLSTASYFVLIGGFHQVPFVAGVIHTTLLVGWIMQHHIPDIPADLAATPRKLTTPALFFLLWGPEGAVVPSIIYYSLAAFLSFLGFLYIHEVFAWMLVPSFIGVWAGATTDTVDIHDVTKRQLITTAAIVANSVIFALLI
ncbi:MAG TPA: prenyltransferase [Thermoanaerobacterales bacterium]|jgi:1,4-dihydroxy-2-naphthoate octaprenyltransferase|nr:prenyltransferase [Thermoanaerobacterales bacterium]